MSERIDLTDFQFMPLFIGRLQKSKAWLRCKRQPELAFYMLNLWLRSWHEIPAGTIENDDDVLADAAMCSPEKWEKIKDKVLAGWETTEEGRLQHPVVAEIAARSWADKQEYRRKKEEERLRKAAKRAQSGNGSEPDAPDLSGGHPADIPPTDGGIPPETALKGKGEVRDSVREEDNKKTHALEFSSDEVRIIASLDEAIAQHYGAERGRQWPHPNDHVYAKRMLETGADADLICETIRFCVGNWAADGQDPPNQVRTFEKWVASAYRDRIAAAKKPPRPDAPPAPTASAADRETERWKAKIANFRKDGWWSPDNGPKPGEPDCKVPAHLLIEITPPSQSSTFGQVGAAA